MEKNRPALRALARGKRAARCALSPARASWRSTRCFPLVSGRYRVSSRLAGLEGSRHEEQGAMDEAWSWYRAMLRASRHVGKHGVIIERHDRCERHARDCRPADHSLGGRSSRRCQAAPPSARRHARRRRHDPSTLRGLEARVPDVPPRPGRAPRHGQGCPHAGRAVRLARTVGCKATGAKVPIQQIRLRATNDVERSRRAMRLLFANWLAQVDKPASKRAPIAISKPTLIYAADPTAPPAARAVAPEDPRQGHLTTRLSPGRCFAPMTLPRRHRRWSTSTMGRRRAVGPRAASPRRADRQAGRRAVPARAWPASRDGRCARRAVSQGLARGDRADDPIPAGLE